VLRGLSLALEPAAAARFTAGVAALIMDSAPGELDPGMVAAAFQAVWQGGAVPAALAAPAAASDDSGGLADQDSGGSSGGAGFSSGGGSSLDSGRQLSDTRPISSGDGGSGRSEGSSGGSSLDSERQLRSTQPISSGGGGGINSAFQQVAAALLVWAPIARRLRRIDAAWGGFPAVT
jgi:hypothetical protein